MSCLHHGIFVTPPHLCIFIGVCFQSHIDDLVCPLCCLMHVNPPPVLARYLWFVPAGPMLFCALRKIPGGIGGCTGFISWIVSWWYVICWEGEIFHDLSEVNLVFSPFRRDCLEGFQGDAAGCWVIINGVCYLGVGNAMLYFVTGWIGIPGGLAVAYDIHCRNWVFIFIVGVSLVSGVFLCGDFSCVYPIPSHVRVWGGAGFICFWRGSKFFLGFLLNSRAILRPIASDYSVSAIFLSVLHVNLFSVSSQ